jgi:hypothetical protein
LPALTALLARCGAEGVGGRQQDGLARPGQVPRELADGSRLARTVDARDHDHRRLGLADHERLLQRLEHLREGFDEQILHLHRMRRARGLDPLAHGVEQVLRGLDAGVGHQQCRLQILVQGFVDLPAREHPGNARTGLAQPGLQPLHPALTLRGLGRGGRHLDRRDQCRADEGARSGGRRYDSGRG